MEDFRVLQNFQGFGQKLRRHTDVRIGRDEDKLLLDERKDPLNKRLQPRGPHPHDVSILYFSIDLRIHNQVRKQVRRNYVAYRVGNSSVTNISRELVGILQSHMRAIPLFQTTSARTSSVLT